MQTDFLSAVQGYIDSSNGVLFCWVKSSECGRYIDIVSSWKSQFYVSICLMGNEIQAGLSQS